MSRIVKEELIFEKEKNLKRYRIENFGDLSISILDYGLTIESLKYKGINRVLTLKNPQDYFTNKHFIGSTIGRVAGRLSKGLIDIDGRKHPLDQNAGAHCLHGGFQGLSHKKWKYCGSYPVSVGEGEEELSLEFSTTSKDGEGGFPGNLNIKARFSICKKGKLTMEYFAKTDKKTPITITNHSYFNLNKEPMRTIENHYLIINSREYLQLKEDKIPKVFRGVEGTLFDFRDKRNLGEAIQQLKKSGEEGMDHPFIFHQEEKKLQLLCHLSNTRLAINTTEPCVIVYSGNLLSQDIQFKEQGPGKPFQGVCLETQWYPNALNTDFLPKNFISPQEGYYSKTEYEFQQIE
ncbi:aldose epimerase family protein [Isachenkonia alkalipeptolytica]|uniref:Aldose 1-epimerase n=1 Tax=Isachenkonia alkalipeptolytica TaxID=2565777 RepID=A0AA43XHX9_9CLOT|nr:aldose epimerase family protein [Isachenkonia alkalipeptolytica]NBG87137.1 galactose mutarotase [Isachenkonia alkalipeptolytica]